MSRKLVLGVLLTLVLIVLWLVLSGYWFKPILLFFGACGVITAMALTLRTGLLDDESAPFPRILPFLSYWRWLGGEILKANVYVVRTALKPELDITPTLTRVPVRAESGLARATFANSITLTPGTVTVEVEENGFLVHALSRELTDQEAFAEMERRTIEAADGGVERSGKAGDAS
ncbi:MAG: Na+/H+ antiporter subunit E [Pseudomonadota bacterium]